MNESQKNRRTHQDRISRRHFLAGGAASIGAFTIIPRHVLGGPGHIPPSERVRLASVGAGGMAGVNIRESSTYADIVALCDVDDRSAEGIYKQFPDVPKYRDFRVMLEKEHNNIEGVIVATPDHTHAVAAMMAIKMGKHVYVQKPLTHSISETRQLTEAARQYKVATQMGNQGHSSKGTRLTIEWVADGAIGSIREVHCWTDRPSGHWPQGIARPTETPPIPPELDWDLWLGTAPDRPYHPLYVPLKWRGFWDFGTGALGDMGCHILDVPIATLKLGYPTSVQAVYTNVDSGEKREAAEKETPPVSSIIKYEFPARGEMPPVTLYWYDGGLKPFPPKDLEEDRTLRDNGYLLIGDEGTMLAGSHGGTARIIPEAKMKAYQRPPQTLPRIEPPNEARHEWDWLQACKGERPACSNFDVSGPITEVVLLGNLALRCGDRKLLWDGPNMRVTNYDPANQYVRREYRNGWAL